MNAEINQLRNKLDIKLKALLNEVTPLSAPSCLKRAEKLVFGFNERVQFSVGSKLGLGINDDAVDAVDNARLSAENLAKRYLKSNSLSLSMSYDYARKSPVFARLTKMYLGVVLLDDTSVAHKVKQAISYNIDQLDEATLKLYEHRQKKVGRDTIQLSLFSN